MRVGEGEQVGEGVAGCGEKLVSLGGVEGGGEEGAVVVGEGRMAGGDGGFIGSGGEAHAGLAGAGGDALPAEVHGLGCGDGDGANGSGLANRFQERGGPGEGFERAGQVGWAAVDVDDDLALERGHGQLGRVEVVIIGFRQVQAIADEDERGGDGFRLRGTGAEDGVFA